MAKVFNQVASIPQLLTATICRNSWLFIFYILALSCLLFSSWLAIDPDLFARMAVGKLIATSGSVPLTDHFAWTEKLPLWIDHEWLAGLVFYALHELGGEWLLFCFKLCVVLLTAMFLRQCVLVQYAPFTETMLAFLTLTLFASSYLWFGTLRCQIFTYLFLVVTWHAILAHRERRERLPLLLIVLLMPLWANLHGGFTLGIISLGVYTVDALIRKNHDPFPLMVTLAAGALTLINPYGSAYWDFIISALSKPRPQIAEWAGVHPLSERGLILTIFSVLVAIDQLRRRSRKSLTAYTIVFFAAYCGYVHARLIAFGLFAIFAFFPEVFERSAQMVKGVTDYIYLKAILAGVCVILMCAGTVSLARFISSYPTFSLNYDPYPVAAVEWAKKNHPGSRILNPFDQGSYILWAGSPHLRVSMDGRYEEVYPESTFQKNIQAFSADTALRARVAEEWKPDLIMAPKSIATTDGYGPDWLPVYSDERWQIFRRG